MAKSNYIAAQHPERGTLFAAFDPAVHHVAGRVADRRFSAFLSPFKTKAEAIAALIAEGCEEAVHGS